MSTYTVLNNFLNSLFRSASKFFKRLQFQFLSLIISKDNRSRNRRDRYSRSMGFTLIELLVVMVMVSVLIAIIGPAWSGFISGQRLSSSQTKIFQAVKLAQSEAKIRQSNNSNRTRITFTTGTTSGAFKIDNVRADNGKLQSLDQGIVISSVKAGGVSYSSPIEFDSRGFLYDPNQTLALPVCINVATSNTSKTKWVKIQTLLGAIVTGSDNTCA